MLCQHLATPLKDAVEGDEGGLGGVITPWVILGGGSEPGRRPTARPKVLMRRRGADCLVVVRHRLRRPAANETLLSHCRVVGIELRRRVCFFAAISICKWGSWLLGPGLAFIRHRRDNEERRGVHERGDQFPHRDAEDPSDRRRRRNPRGVQRRRRRGAGPRCGRKFNRMSDYDDVLAAPAKSADPIASVNKDRARR
jgi:hypothetical protein